MSRNVTGRRAIVTGAASGIGAAAVKRLRADGCAVLAVDVVASGLSGTCNYVANLDDADQIPGMAAEANAKLGGLDILINNAGVCPVSPFDDMTEDQWALALSVNVSAVMRLTRACLPMLRASGSGRVINTGSILSRYGDAGLVAYATPNTPFLGSLGHWRLSWGATASLSTAFNPVRL